ncbi:Mce-associated membrane protein [Sinosporangium album]|uniref:Mce-associated membrane protein n=1 Tax=Sinosporangium album TaxID=504805 RepID=A0A1G8J7I1_9ACTN|nr:hypothetical protein [Sinosporangium album]SDI27062.1 Mce-associated membrane protein [Sinosporangium album]
MSGEWEPGRGGAVRSSPVATWVVALLAAVALALGAAVGVMWMDLGRLQATETLGREALAAARMVAPDMLSYDYRTIEQDMSRAQGQTTGDLTRHYRELAQTLVPRAKSQQAAQQATVSGAAVERVEGDRVDVLLFMNIEVTKTPEGEKEPRHEFMRNRARFVMVKSGSRWLVAVVSTLLGTA